MGKISEIVGVVTDGKIIENRVYASEVFYTIKVKFLNVEIPVLFSAYINNKDLEEGSKIRVKGCLMSDIRKDQLPQFYFYAHEINYEDADAECTNEVSFVCTITKIKEFTVNSNGKAILSLVGADNNPLGLPSIIYMYLSNRDARRLKNREKGYVIMGKGRIRAYKDIYEICVTEVDNIDQIVSPDSK